MPFVKVTVQPACSDYKVECTNIPAITGAIKCTPTYFYFSPPDGYYVLQVTSPTFGTGTGVIMPQSNPVAVLKLDIALA